MIKIEAQTLEEAFQKAAKELNCSVADLKYEVLQYPKKGIFGIGKKSAIIVADVAKKETTKEMKKEFPQTIFQKNEKKPSKQETNLSEQQEETTQKLQNTTTLKETKVDLHIKDELFDNFYKEKPKEEEVIEEVKFYIDRLFENSCYKLNPVSVKLYDEHTLFIEFSGEDAALLIGKEGYRYKALSYMLFNWINSKYGYMIRLEIAEFLKNQEEMMRHKLAPFIEKVKEIGKGETEPFDGVLAHIALKQLREAFPNKYVSFRSKDDKKYVVVDDFIQKSETQEANESKN